MSTAFPLLAALRDYPATADYYIDLGAAAGGKTMLRLLREQGYGLRMRALHYAAMDDSARARERRSWQGGYAALAERCQSELYRENLRYSLPVPRENRQAVPPLSTSGAYRFEQLVSASELIRAGKALENCLAGMPMAFGESTVLAVRENGGYTAAVQIKGTYIVQAMCAQNRLIKANSPLGQAFQAWARRYGLHLPEMDEEEDSSVP